jgi:hypothetical protein
MEADRDLSALLEQSIGVQRIVMHVASSVHSGDIKCRDTVRMQEGRIMAGTRELESTGSWLERVRAQGTVTPGPSSESASIARALAGNAIEGWDPYEVWLHRVRWPRERRNDRPRD